MSGFWEEDISSYITICDRRYTKITQIFEQKNLSVSTVREADNPSEIKILITININSKDEEFVSCSLQERKDIIRNRFEQIKAEYSKVCDIFQGSNRMLRVIGMEEAEVDEPYERTLYILTEDAVSLEKIYYVDSRSTICLGEVFTLAIDLCKIMEQMIQAGVYHRGLCPRLIFKKENGAYVIGNICPQRRGPEKKGVYGFRERSYLAPELFYPAENYEIIHFEKVNEKTEIYNLGAVLYEILDHKHILFQEDASDLQEAEIRRINGETPLPPDTGTIRLGECIRKACSSEDQRYDSFKEFREELESIYYCLPSDKRDETIFESLYDDTQIDPTSQVPNPPGRVSPETEDTDQKDNLKRQNDNKKKKKKCKIFKKRKKRKKKKEEEIEEIDKKDSDDKKKIKNLTEEDLKAKEKALKLMVGGCFGLIAAIILAFVLLNYNASEKEIYNLIDQKNYGLASERIVKLAESGKNVDEVSKKYIDACIKDHTTKNIPKVVRVLSDDVTTDYYESMLYSLESTNQTNTCNKVIQVLDEKGIKVEGYTR